MESLAIFKLLDAKLAYTAQRQGVLANNIANADTPGYRAMDLKPMDFKAILKAKETTRADALALTNTLHIPAQSLQGNDPNASSDIMTYEVAPSGNSVDIEEQMLKAGKNSLDATVVTNLFAKQLALLRLAAGVNGR